MLKEEFFSRDACKVAQGLLGKVIRHKVNQQWLAAQIIETEAYYCSDKASHSSLGYSEKRKAMFMAPATIYMYYARGKDSLNISCGKKGDAVLIKAAFPYFDKKSPENLIKTMQQLNPNQDGSLRTIFKLCCGQTLLCKALDLKVMDWDQQQFSKNSFYLQDVKYKPNKIIQTTRLGIQSGRDAHLHYRFIDHAYAQYCSSNPLTKQAYEEGTDYVYLFNI